MHQAVHSKHSFNFNKKPSTSSGLLQPVVDQTFLPQKGTVAYLRTSPIFLPCIWGVRSKSTFGQGPRLGAQDHWVVYGYGWLSAAMSTLSVQP